MPVRCTGEKSACIFIENFQIPEEFRYSKSVSVKRAKQISHLNSPRIYGAIEDRKFVNGEWEESVTVVKAFGEVAM
jgi:hypothetical protein